MKIIDKIALIEIKDKKVLVTRSKGKDLFYIPGGKREIGESDIDTLQREIKEELSVYVIPNSATYFGTFYAEADGKGNDILVKTTCYMADFTGNLSVDNEIDEMEWLSYDDLDKVSRVVQFIFYELRHKGLI